MRTGMRAAAVALGLTAGAAPGWAQVSDAEFAAETFGSLAFTFHGIAIGIGYVENERTIIALVVAIAHQLILADIHAVDVALTQGICVLSRDVHGLVVIGK